jgi:hypothetical protein
MSAQNDADRDALVALLRDRKVGIAYIPYAMPTWTQLFDATRTAMWQGRGKIDGTVFAVRMRGRDVVLYCNDASVVLDETVVWIQDGASEITGAPRHVLVMKRVN